MMTKGALVEILAALKYFWQVWLEEKLRNWLPDPDNTPETRPMNVEPVPAVLPTPAPTPEILKWDTPKQTWHSVRVMCDNSGLTFTQKNIVCACIWQESNFLNYLPNGEPVTHKNIKNGKVWSTDYGLLQCNDYWWIGAGKLFPSVDYVMHNPDVVVQWMIDYMKANNHLKRWSSYSSGAYKAHLPLTSPMWKLAEK